MALEGRTDKLGMHRKCLRGCLFDVCLLEGLFAGKFPGADDFQSVDVRQIPGKRRKRRSQPHNSLRCLIQQRLPGRLQYQYFKKRAVAVDRDHQAQIAVNLFTPRFIRIIEVTDALDLFAPLILIPGAFVAHGRGRAQAVDTRALGVQLLFVGQFRFEAGDVAGQLFTVERRRGDGGFGGRFGLFGLGRSFLRLRCDGGHGSLGRCFLDFRLGGRRWRDFLHLVVLERRDLGGLGNRLFIQGAAAFLIFLREEVGLRRFLFALEGGEGDFQGFADLFGFDHRKADAQQQGQVNQRR